jgi:AAA15 family ATPase/GTPase
MISKIKVKNYTVFEDAEFDFSPGLNIIVGENSTGKSLLMKLAYSCSAVSYRIGKGERKGKEEWQRVLADKLREVCKPDTLGRLVTRKPGRNRCDIDFRTSRPKDAGFSFSFATNATSEVKLDKAPGNYISAAPIFIPTKEVLSVFPGFAATLRERHLQFDETYLDLAEAVERPALKRIKPEEEPLKDALEEIMKGKVIIENGRFYILSNSEGKGKIEMPLVAEGIRKIALLAYLVMNGGLRDKSVLFWDEPEVNLNPRLMRPLAKALVDMAEKGVQIVLATHSLFMIRELEISSKAVAVTKAVRYFALSMENEEVKVSSGDSADAVSPIASLEAELEQSDRFLALE